MTLTTTHLEIVVRRGEWSWSLEAKTGHHNRSKTGFHPRSPTSSDEGPLVRSRGREAGVLAGGQGDSRSTGIAHDDG